MHAELRHHPSNWMLVLLALEIVAGCMLRSACIVLGGVIPVQQVMQHE